MSFTLVSLNLIHTTVQKSFLYSLLISLIFASQEPNFAVVFKELLSNRDFSFSEFTKMSTIVQFDRYRVIFW